MGLFLNLTSPREAAEQGLRRRITNRQNAGGTPVQSHPKRCIVRLPRARSLQTVIGLSTRSGGEVVEPPLRLAPSPWAGWLISGRKRNARAPLPRSGVSLPAWQEEAEHAVSLESAQSLRLE